MRPSPKVVVPLFLALGSLAVAATAAGCDVSVGGGDLDGGSVDATTDVVAPKDATKDEDTGADTGVDAGADTGTDSAVPDAGDAGTCTNPNQTEKFAATCQACLEKSCCTKLTACFNIPKDGAKLDCNGLTKCVSDCRGDVTKTPAEQDACANDCADADANTAGVIDAYNGIIECTNQNCATQCD